MGDKIESLLGKKCDNFKQLIANDVNQYLDLSIPDFLSHKAIGDARLISWPDRLLNTIDNKNDSYLYRPTVINYYQQTFKHTADWFALWTAFMKETGLPILEQNVDNKYAKKFGREDNAIFLHLNVVLLGIFDALMVFMLFDIQSKQGINWQAIKRNLYGILNENKLNRTMEIINKQYSGFDILFLQEVRNNLLEHINGKDASVNLTQFADNYHIIFPEKVSKNNQTSIVCLNKKRFDLKNVSVKDVTSLFFKGYKGKMGINHGDLICICVSDYLLISFHGDTGGMASGDLMKTISAVHKEKFYDYKLLIGIDANTYYANAADGKKKYSVNAFHDLLSQLKLNSCFDGVLPSKHTTNCPRTYLQPQLNKAVKKEDIVMAKTDFRSPKDFIVFGNDRFDVMDGQTVIDNMANGKYNADVEYVWPSQDFPSDHAILSTHLKERKNRKNGGSIVLEPSFD